MTDSDSTNEDLPAEVTEAHSTEAAEDQPSDTAGDPPQEDVVEPTAEKPPLTEEQVQVQEKIVEVLCDIYDPEIPVSIHALGMIYEVDCHNLPEAVVTMTLTSPACPVAGTLPGEVETRVQMVEGVELARVNLVWDPPWSPDLMSEAAKLQLNMF